MNGALVEIFLLRSSYLFYIWTNRFLHTRSPIWICYGVLRSVIALSASIWGFTFSFHFSSACAALFKKVYWLSSSLARCFTADLSLNQYPNLVERLGGFLRFTNLRKRKTWWFPIGGSRDLPKQEYTFRTFARNYWNREIPRMGHRENSKFLFVGGFLKNSTHSKSDAIFIRDGHVDARDLITADDRERSAL